MYTKQRKEFGKHCNFAAAPATVLEIIPAVEHYQDNYIMRNPSVSCFDTSPHMYVTIFYNGALVLMLVFRSEHAANTERLITKSSSMRHVEGGWPKDVDFNEQSDVSRFRKKAEKDEDYKGAVKNLGPIIARCMKQNNTINIYEVGLYHQL